MVVSIGAVASAAQGVSYYERDGYYAKDDATHREASAWFGKGAAALGLEGTVDPDLFTDILAGEVPDGSGLRLGRRNREGEIEHRPGRDLTFSAPKSVSIAALIGGDERIAGVHDAAVRKALAWIEANAAETRMMDPELGRMVRTGDQSIVAATFTHEVSRNLDPQLHTHAVIANMVQGEDGGTSRSGGTPRSGKWRTMANEKLYASKMLIGVLYRAELARGLEELGYAIEKTHADGRFEIAGAPGRSPVPRTVIDAFSTRRAEIEAAMASRGLGDPAANQRMAERAALVTRSHKRDVDKEALRETWQRQASELDFDAQNLVAGTRHWQATFPDQHLTSAGHDREAEPGVTAEAQRAAAWAVEHLSEREAVFARTDLLTATLARNPGKVSIEEAEAAVGRMEKMGTLHAARTPVLGDALTTDKALIDETETIALMERGQGRSKPVMRKWIASPLLHNGRLPALHNTDDEPIVFCRVRFPIVGDEAEVATMLDGVECFERDEEDEPSWTWSVPGTPLHRMVVRRRQHEAAKWGSVVGNTPLGHTEMETGALTLFVNSRERAERGRDLLASCLGDLVGPPLISHQDPKMALDEEAGQSHVDPESPPDEAVQVIHSCLDGYYRRMLDDPHPSVDGKTLRQATRTRKGREKVIDWLKQMENTEHRRAAQQRHKVYDTSWIWRELGIEAPR